MLPSGTLTIDVDEGAHADFTNAEGQDYFTGSGNICKTGSGTLTLPFRSDSIWGKTSVEAGSLIMHQVRNDTSTYGDVSVAYGATLKKSGGLTGTLVYSGTVSGAGTLACETGTLQVNGSTADFIGFLAVGSGATMDFSTNGVTLIGGQKISGAGTVAGAVTLEDSVTLDVSSATASSRLTFTGDVTAEGNVALVLPSSPASGLQLIQWTAAPEGATYTAEELPALARLRVEDAGLYCDVMSVDGGSAGSDKGAISDLSDAVQRELAELAFAKNATSIGGITGTQGGSALSASDIDSALTCFELTPVVDVVDGVATFTVTYDFGISGMSLKKVDGTPQVTVQAMIQNGDAIAKLSSSALMVLQQKSISGTDDWATILDAAFTPDENNVYSTTVSVEDISNVKFRVLAKTLE